MDPRSFVEAFLEAFRPDEHGGIRTPDPQNRNLMLYPTELHVLGFWEHWSAVISEPISARFYHLFIQRGAQVLLTHY